MGLFGGIFGKGEGNKEERKLEIPWIALAHMEQLDEISAKSTGKPQFLFKHSTTCGISRMVLNGFKSSYSLASGQADFYFLDLHAYRAVSNGIAQKFQVIHQSPQLLVVKNGVVVAHASHGGIAEIALEAYV